MGVYLQVVTSSSKCATGGHCAFDIIGTSNNKKPTSQAAPFVGIWIEDMTITEAREFLEKPEALTAYKYYRYIDMNDFTFVRRMCSVTKAYFLSKVKTHA